MKSAFLEFKKGHEIYLKRDFKKVNETFFYVSGKSEKEFHYVDMNNWFCL